MNNKTYNDDDDDDDVDNNNNDDNNNYNNNSFHSPYILLWSPIEISCLYKVISVQELVEKQGREHTTYII